MKQIIISLVVLVLAGCSSISEMRERGPHSEFKSKKKLKFLLLASPWNGRNLKLLVGALLMSA